MSRSATRKEHKVIITGGEHSGIAIDTPGGDVHPMGMRERLAIFNMIQGRLPDADVIDICAGSGILGIEAMSRGAKRAVFVDANELALQTIERNLYEIRTPIGKAVTLKLKIEDIGQISAETYDVVFVDPPYDKYRPRMVTSLVHLVSDGGIIVASTPERPPEIPGFEIIKARQYARCHVTIYQKN